MKIDYDEIVKEAKECEYDEPVLECVKKAQIIVDKLKECYEISDIFIKKRADLRVYPIEDGAIWIDYVHTNASVCFTVASKEQDICCFVNVPPFPGLKLDERESRMKRYRKLDDFPDQFVINAFNDCFDPSWDPEWEKNKELENEE